MKKLFSIIICMALIITANSFSFESAANVVQTQSGLQAMRDSLSLVWNDEFGQEGDAKANIDDTKWSHEGSTVHRNGQVQVYADEDGQNSWTEDGKLIIEARRETRTGLDGITSEFTSDCLRSSYLDSEGNECLKGFTYGMMEARIKTDNAKNNGEAAYNTGLWNGFWTCGLNVDDDGTPSTEYSNNDWPYNGEIDIMECWTKSTGGCNLEKSCYHHSTTRKGESVKHTATLTSKYQTFGSTTMGDDGYHTYGVYWTPSQLMFYVDEGVTGVFDITSDEYYALRENPQFMILSFPLGGSTCGDISDDFQSAQYAVDYVRVYQAKSQNSATANDYSHINIIKAMDTNYDLTQISKNEPTIYWGLNRFDSSLFVLNSADEFDMVTTNKFNEGKYDVFLSGLALESTCGKCGFKLNGIDTGQSADYTVGNILVSNYIGTAEIVNSEHNMSISLTKEQNGGSYYAMSQVFFIIGNSENNSNVTISNDTEYTQTTKTDSTVSGNSYTVSIDGEAVASTNGAFTFPDCTSDKFVAYTDGENGYNPGDTITVSDDENFTILHLDLTMLYGAAMRLNSKTGIRFYTKVDSTQLNLIRSICSNIKMGTIIAYYDRIPDTDITLNTPQYNGSSKLVWADVPYTGSTLYSEENNNENIECIVGSLVNISDEHANVNFAGRGYISVTIGTTTRTIYAEYPGQLDKNIRSISYIANCLRNDTTSIETYEEHKEIVDKFANMYVTQTDEDPFYNDKFN